MNGSTGALAPPAPTLLKNLVESRGFALAVTIVIAINAVTLGLETWPLAMQTETNEKVRAEALVAHDEREALSRQIGSLTAEIRQIREALGRG